MDSKKPKEYTQEELDDLEAEGQYEAREKARLRRMEFMQELKESGDEHYTD